MNTRGTTNTYEEHFILKAEHVNRHSGCMYIVFSGFLTLVLGGGGLLASHPNHFTPMERVCGTHLTGVQVGPRTGLKEVEERNISFSISNQNSFHKQNF